MLFKLVSIFIGGGIGAILRYGLTVLSSKYLTTPIIGTFSANIIGCFLIGCFFGFVLNKAEEVPQVTKLFITTGFTSFNRNPQNVYRVYLKGKSIGLIESKEELENYINKKQSEIKKQYNVDKVYPPRDLDIVKEKTFSDKLKTTKEIYNEIIYNGLFDEDNVPMKCKEVLEEICKYFNSLWYWICNEFYLLFV